VLCDRPAVAGVELRGGANDVVGLDYLDPRHLVSTVEGVVLGGGSRFGGESIWGVMRWLEGQGRGFAAGPTVVPHVPGAFIFDLNVGGGRARPTREMGAEAAARAVPGPVAEGNVGAGTGATVGKVHRLARAMRGGLGSASRRLGDVVVGAIVVVNAVGDVRDPETGALIAGARESPDSLTLVDSAGALVGGRALERFAAPEHTTIGAIATNARLSKPEASKVAALGMLGFARALAASHCLRWRHALRPLRGRSAGRSHAARPGGGGRGGRGDRPRRARGHLAAGSAGGARSVAIGTRRR